MKIKKEIQELEAEIKKREHDLNLILIPKTPKDKQSYAIAKSIIRSKKKIEKIKKEFKMQKSFRG